MVSDTSPMFSIRCVKSNNMQHIYTTAFRKSRIELSLAVVLLDVRQLTSFYVCCSFSMCWELLQSPSSMRSNWQSSTYRWLLEKHTVPLTEVSTRQIRSWCLIAKKINPRVCISLWQAKKWSNFWTKLILKILYNLGKRSSNSVVEFIRGHGCTLRTNRILTIVVPNVLNKTAGMTS